jgi:hypothetical protein
MVVNSHNSRRFVRLLCGSLLVVCALALSSCGDQPEVVATPLPIPTSAPTPTPTPTFALGLKKQGILFHDLTANEQVCPSLAEFLAPVELATEDFSDRPAEVVRQVRLVCTSEEKGTVYFIDLENQTITVTRKPPPVPGMP